MVLEVRIYSCYQRTYGEIYQEVLSYLYPNGGYDEIQIKIDDISNNNERNIQSQRSLNQYAARTIRIYEGGKLVHIVGISNTNFDYDKLHEKEIDSSKKYEFGELNYHANTYLMQGIVNIFNFYFKQKKIYPDVDLSFYLLDLDNSYPHNLFNILSYRELATIGFKILNISKVKFDKYNKAVNSSINGNMNIAFSSFTKYVNDIAIISKKNNGNKSSYLDCKEHIVDGEGSLYFVDKYIYKFKSLSAQGYDSLIRIWCMKVLADKEEKAIEFVLGRQYFNYGGETMSIAKELTKPIKETFKNAGIEIKYLTDNEFMIEKRTGENTYSKAKKINNPRNQSLFRQNLRKCGGPFCCAVCGNDNSLILEAAHLWDVESIKNANKTIIDNFLDRNISYDFINQQDIHKDDLFFKKYSLTNNGYNGIWLCPSCHDEFDRGIFSLIEKNGKVIVKYSKNSKVVKLNQKLPNESIAFLQERNLSRSGKNISQFPGHS